MGIFDFVRRNSRYCDYFFLEHYIISVKYAFLLVTNLFNTDVCGTVLQGNSLIGERKGKRRFLVNLV